MRWRPTFSWLFTSLARSAVEAACLPARLERLKAQSGGSLDAEERLKRRLYESVVPKARLTLRPSIAVVLSNGAPHPAAVKRGLRWKRNRLRISPQEVVRLMEASPEHPPLLLDIRSTDAYEKSPLRIPSSIRITPQELESGRPGLALDPERTIVVHCTSRHEAASARVARQLRRLGCRDVRILEGGLAAWTNAGLPLDSKPTLPQKP